MSDPFSHFKRICHPELIEGWQVFFHSFTEYTYL